MSGRKESECQEGIKEGRKIDIKGAKEGKDVSGMMEGRESKI